MKGYIERFIKEEEGASVVEVILILAILIALILLFKTQIERIVTNAFTSITSDANSIVGVKE